MRNLLCSVAVLVAAHPAMAAVVEPQTFPINGGVMVTAAIVNQEQLHIRFSDNRPEQTLETGIDPQMTTRASLDTYDYNFDGITDISLTYPDSAMGVNTLQDLYLYDPEAKRFAPARFAKGNVANCDETLEKASDAKRKTLHSKYRSGASWFKDTFAYNTQGQLYCVKHQDISQKR